ncbi:hypothetical protein [Pantoea piersonii]|uniref:hypothetical protein n=1 Tax=Pantoea piersonii TaxID=2364647 RepID=UPI0028996FC5|nr:hypothetical protein [Pantoea piersonii]
MRHASIYSGGAVCVFLLAVKNQNILPEGYCFFYAPLFNVQFIRPDRLCSRKNRLYLPSVSEKSG